MSTVVTVDLFETYLMSLLGQAMIGDFGSSAALIGIYFQKSAPARLTQVV